MGLVLGRDFLLFSELGNNRAVGFDPSYVPQNSQVRACQNLFKISTRSATRTIKGSDLLSARAGTYSQSQDLLNPYGEPLAIN